MTKSTVRVILLAILLVTAVTCHAGAKSRLVARLESGDEQTLITYGTSLTAGGAWVQQLQKALNSRYPGKARVINSGQGAMWSTWGVDNLDARVIQKQPDTVLIEFAINDAYLPYETSVAKAKSNLETMIDRILTSNAACEIILMVMNPPIDIHLERRPKIKDYYQMYRDVAKARKFLLIDHYPQWETILEDKDLFNTYVPDGIHPGPEGCQYVITPEIIRVLGIGSSGESLLRPSNQATLVIDTDAASTPYDRMIFGGFIEHFGKQIYGGVFEPGSPLADEAGFRMDVIAALKELKVPVIRWPGGCFVDGYHWRDGVGDRREPRDDIRWGVIEPHTFGTHEFVEFCRRLGAEPYICHNGLASVQEMIDWVEYCNGRHGPFASLRKKNGQADPFDVTFWSVGNEREGQAYIHKVRDGARGMKQVDSSVLVTCSGTHSESRVSPYLLEVAGEHLDYLSVHDYWIRNFQTHQTPDYLTCIMLSERPQVYINRVCDALDQAGLRGRIKLAFDEWNLRSWHHPGFQRQEKVDYDDPEIVQLIKARDKSLDPALYTMADALFAASFLNACLRHASDVGMANIAPLVNQTGPLYVHPRGIVRRSHFHTMAMYANQLESRVGTVHVTADTLTQGKDSVAVVDGIATVDKLGKNWAIALVNRHPSDSVACTVRMKGMRLEGQYNATVLTGDSPDAYNDIEHPNQVVPEAMKVTFSQGVTQLPAHSLIIMHVSTRKTP